MANRNKQGRFIKGLIPWNKKEPILKECKVCGDVMELTDCQLKRKKFCSKECFYIGRELKNVFKSGSEHPAYINGSSIGRAYKNEFHKKSKKLREGATECVNCGESERQLLVHHKDGDRDNNKDENLSVICYSCHNRHHIKGTIEYNGKLYSERELAEKAGIKRSTFSMRHWKYGWDIEKCIQPVNKNKN